MQFTHWWFWFLSKFKKCLQKCSHKPIKKDLWWSFSIPRTFQGWGLICPLDKSLFHFSKHNVLAKFWWIFLQLKTVWSVTFVFWSKVQAFTRFFVFKCNIYAHGISLLLFRCLSFSDFTSLVVTFEGYAVRTWVISSCFIKFNSWSCQFVMSTTFILFRFWRMTCRYCHDTSSNYS